MALEFMRQGTFRKIKAADEAKWSHTLLKTDSEVHPTISFGHVTNSLFERSASLTHAHCCGHDVTVSEPGISGLTIVCNYGTETIVLIAALTWP